MSKREINGTEDMRKSLRLILLASTDWYSIRHRDQLDQGETPSLTQDQWVECQSYRNALRAWPVSGDTQEALPEKPRWMK